MMFLMFLVTYARDHTIIFLTGHSWIIRRRDQRVIIVGRHAITAC
jgi:hypothetical protein